MIDDYQKRIAGIHYANDGRLAAVWLAHDKYTDRVRVYDCALFAPHEVLEVIASGLNGRGQWIPVAWSESAKALSDKLLFEHGVGMLPDPVEDDPATADMTTRSVWARMRSSRFTVNEELADLKAEFESFMRDENAEIPAYPIMAAIRYAVAMLDWAKVPTTGKRTVCAPKLNPV